MKLSFIIITRDRPKELEDCLSSIERQRFPAFEVILIDSSRGEKMDGLLKKHGNMACRYYYYPDAGTAKSRNYGIRQSSGDVNVFVDDDVILSPDYTREIVKYFMDNPDTGGITGPIYDRISTLRYGLSEYEMSNLKNSDDLFYRTIRDDIETYTGHKFIVFYKKYVHRRYARKLIKAGKILFFLDSCRPGKTTLSGFANSLPTFNTPYRTQGVHGCNMAFKKEVFSDHLMDEHFEKNLHYAIYEDHEFAYRVSKRYPISMVPTVALYHRKTPTSRIRYDELFEAILVNIHYLVSKDMNSTVHKAAFAWSVFGVLCGLLAAQALSPGKESQARLKGAIKGIRDILNL